MEQTQYLQMINSPWLWLASGAAVSVVVVQAFIFARKSYQTGLEIGLTRTQMNDAMRSSLIAAIGPSIVVLSAMIALLVSVGGPVAWLRLAFIGSAGFELMAANFGAKAVGVTLGSDPMTGVAFANAVWTMVLGSIGWIIFATLTADKMEKVQHRVAGNDSGLIGIISSAAVLAAFGANGATYLVMLNKNAVSCIAGAAVMLLLSPYADAKNIKWLKEWVLFFALVGGLVAAVVWPF